MSSALLDEKILAVQRALVAAEVPHAFGGALALAYYATPRGTVDIDINVFVGVERWDLVFGALRALGVGDARKTEKDRLRLQGQTRVFWDHTPIDLFFSYDPLHDACFERSREVPFGGEDRLRILSAEDLAVFKVLFDRRKDWDDLAELLFAQGGDFDADYALQWLRKILESDDARLARFEELLAA